MKEGKGQNLEIAFRGDTSRGTSTVGGPKCSLEGSSGNRLGGCLGGSPEGGGCLGRGRGGSHGGCKEEGSPGGRIGEHI